MQSQQCYHHLLTRYLIFENVLIVYGIILEFTDVSYLTQCVYTGYIGSWTLSSLYILCTFDTDIYLILCLFPRLGKVWKD